MVELAAKTSASDAIAAKLDDLALEAESLKRELAEMECGVPVLERDHVRFWVARVLEEEGASKVVAAFVTRVVVDRGQGMLWVEFAYGGEGGGPFPSSPGGFGGKGPGEGGVGGFSETKPAPARAYPRLRLYLVTSTSYVFPSNIEVR